MSSEFAKNDNLSALLRELPYAQEQQSANCLYVSGVLATSEPGFVRIVLGDYCLTLDVADVQDILQVSAKDEGRGTPPMVRLTLQCPARLLNVELWTELEQATCGARRPFAFAARPHPIVASPNLKFRSREQNFLRELEQ